MNKTYLLAPLLALLLFGGIYWQFQSGYQAREHARQEETRLAREAKLNEEIEARRLAIEDALRAQELRKKEREQKEAEEKAARELRQAALDARDHAYREQNKIVRQIERQKKDLAAAQEELARLQETRKAALAEQAFLQTYVSKTEANARALADLLTKIDAAETARAAAAKNKS